MAVRHFLLGLFLFFNCLCERCDCAALHAILVIDTNALDLREALISNYWAWEIELKNISLYSQLDLKTYIFKDENANSKFIDELESLDVESDDVILFYWSGHGYRTRDKDSGNNPWPSFSFNGEYKGIDLQQLTEWLSNKNPRLLLSIADTCNHYVPALWAPPIFAIKMQERGCLQHVQTNYYRLFREFSGVIMAAGCQPGQYSWAYIPVGSIFTLSFIQALRDSAKQIDEPNWESVFSKALENLEEYDPPEEQTPIIEIFLR